MIIAIVTFLVILLDRTTKIGVVEHFMLGESLPVIPQVFHITYILNKGAAFGLLANHIYLFLAVVALLIIGLIIYRQRVLTYPKWVQVGIGMLLGGALGNAFDRVHQGAVIDFFDFRIWPIFNVADIGICIGVAILIVYLWRES